MANHLVFKNSIISWKENRQVYITLWSTHLNKRDKSIKSLESKLESILVIPGHKDLQMAGTYQVLRK